jgi:hypothetical protein
MSVTWFGSSNASNNVGTAANFVYWFIATATASGNITDGRAYFNSGSGNARLAVYSVSAGAPSALLGACTARAITGGAGWEAFTYPSPFAVTSGTQYALAWLFNTGYGMGYVASGNYHYQASTYPTFPGSASPTSASGVTGAMEAGVTGAAGTFVPLIAIEI